MVPQPAHRVSVQQKPPECRGLSRTNVWPLWPQSQAAGNPLRHCEADETGQYILLVGCVFKYQ